MTIATTTVPRRRRAAGPAGVGGSSRSAELEVVPVRLALARGGEWAAVELALRRGERDENRLTDLVFAGRHPERQGRPIAAGEQALAREWIEIRDHIVRPALAGRPAPSSDGRPAGGFRPIPIETPGGGRIQDRREPAAADRVTVPGLNGPITLHRLAADAWTAMVDAARADGIAAPLLAPVSGHRSVARQTELWKQALARYKTEQEARKWVAPPGSSAHHSGRALDLYLGGRNDSTNVSALRALPAYHWLQANAQRYGFYPYDREPWHWEYNPPAATQHELWTEAELPLPAPIRQLIDRGQEAAAIALALAQGQRDENKLTDLIFHTRHPERAGAPLTTNEHDLIREWLTIRDTTIRPLLTRTPTTTPTTTPAAPAPGPPPARGSGFVKDSPRLRSVPLAPAKPISTLGLSAATRHLAGVYNRLGGLLQLLAGEVGVEVAAVLAVWYVESAGRAHVPGRAIIRFENHKLYDLWGARQPALYDQHFRHGGRAGQSGERWQGHALRESPGQPFRTLHTGAQESEYAALALATRLAGEDIALRCISIGGPQILGSNYALIGYASPRAMYDAFQADERFHVLGFFDFCLQHSQPLFRYLASRDWVSFARHYNGPGKADEYGREIAKHYEAARGMLARAG